MSEQTSLSDEAPERLLCTAVNRRGRPCGRLGHRLVGGVRFCATHSGEQYEKAPIPCVGQRADGSECSTIAETLHVIEGEDAPLCQYHARLYLEQGALRPVRGRAGRRNGGGRGAAEDDLDALSDLGLEDAAVGTIRERLTGVAHDLFPTASEVLAQALAARKAEMITCPHCGKRHRRLIADTSTRLAALKILLDRTAAPPSFSEPEPLDTSRPLADMSDAELRRAAFGEGR